MQFEIVAPARMRANSARRSTLRSPLPIRAATLLLLIACSNTTTDGDIGSSRVLVHGVVVQQATSQPRANVQVTFRIPLARNDCAGSALGSAYTDPPEVRTDAVGRFQAELTAFGFSPGIYCVTASANAVTTEQAGVRFRALGEKRVDTISLRIEVP